MATGPVCGRQIRISGVVQGVGFRPTVWRLAHQHGIRGEVWNDAAGVGIHAWGAEPILEHFIRQLRDQAPPLAQVEQIAVTPLEALAALPAAFRILDSRPGEAHTGVVPDAATCPECLAEIFDPANRRYRYPFTNCTHCGPRLSIVHAVPYDRAHTSMAPFVMCPACQAEYADPADRRFHAQPNCCDACGPQLWLEDAAGNRRNGDGELIASVARLIAQGAIVAIKGVGGFHLACDAGNAAAVTELRRRKRRHHKPFALMVRDLAMAAACVEVDEKSGALLQSVASPIVVMRRRTERLPAALAPGQSSLGIMLPYTPLHHLLLHELQRPIVLTSGNRSDEPQAIDNDTAKQQLAGIADYFLLHDRDIVNRLDDSLLRIAAGEPRMIRRARGFAPQPLKLPPGFAGANPILAMGAELKNSFCMVKDGQAIMSPYLGDLEQAASYRSYLESIGFYGKLFAARPAAVAVDMHPDYLSTQRGHEIAASQGIPVVAVQHHHAHIAACMAEHGLPLDSGKVLGVALDGLGYGDDGTLWGGEFLLADYYGYRRLGHFEVVPMPGGTQAIHQPWRNTFAQLAHHLGWERVATEYAELELIRYLKGKPLATLQGMITNGINCPPASSAGRLFDAVAVALGLCREGVSYEGQAAVELEALAACRSDGGDRGYGFALQGERLNWTPLWSALLTDLQSGVAPAVIAARFHHTIASAIGECATRYCADHGVNTVVLGGGVFQNRLLLELCCITLETGGCRVLSPARYPANDGGLALGQGVIALAKI